jgi:hypothetical protein
MANPHNLPTQAERITALEVQMSQVLDTQREMNTKLDELLGLRNKGIGAFWLVSGLTGTGMIGLFFTIGEWLKGVVHG